MEVYIDCPTKWQSTKVQNYENTKLWKYKSTKQKHTNTQKYKKGQKMKKMKKRKKQKKSTEVQKNWTPTIVWATDSRYCMEVCMDCLDKLHKINFVIS